MAPRIYPSEQSTNADADGTLIISFDNTAFNSSLSVVINSITRQPINKNKSGFSYYKLNQNDVVVIGAAGGTNYRKIVSIYRRDYTTDDQYANNGIFDTLILSSSDTTTFYTFTATTIPSAYHFEYRVSLKLESTLPTPTPSPTPLPPTNTPTPSPTSTNTPTPLPPTSTPTPTPTLIPFTSIIQSGLTIWTNGNSYVGTGTTWTSVATGTTYNGTLINSPTFSTSNGGNFTFNGTNQWVDFGGSSSGSTTGSYTFGGWVKTTTSATQKIFFMQGNDASGGWSLLLDKNASNKFEVQIAGLVGGFYSSASLAGTTTMVTNTWYYITGIWSFPSTLVIYVNGSLENTSTPFTITSLRPSTFGWTIARNNGSVYTDCSIGDFEYYNRVLSNTEITNNFNSNKALYGY
jgi:hypothetical protein